MDDVVQYQRLASGYVPGESEAFPNTNTQPSAPPVSGRFQNCTVIRPAGPLNAVGVYDILIGGDSPAPIGIGGERIGSPPLNPALSPNEIVVSQGRFRAQVRSSLTQPPSASAQTFPAPITVAYGASFLTTSPYPGFSVNQIIRVFIGFTNAVLDVDFDFDVERVIDPSVEP